MTSRRRISTAFLDLTLVLLLLLATAPQGHAAVRAALFVAEVLPAIPAKPLRWTGPRPEVETVTFPIPGGIGTADLYGPDRKGRHPAVLLFLGVAPAGAADPRVVNLGETFARLGMTAMFYWSPHMAQRQILMRDVGGLVAAFQYLRNRPDVDPSRVGMGGFCVGASFTIMAAADPKIQDNVRYVNAFGPYYDMLDLAVAISSQSQTVDGNTEEWEPDPLTYQVFTTRLAAAIEDRQDRDWLLTAIGEEAPLAPGPPWPMSPKDLAVYLLVRGLPEGEARSAVGHLPTALRVDMRQSSPRSYLGQVKAKVLIMHDRGDRLIPVQESRALWASLESRGSDVIYTEFAFFSHVDPTRPVSPPRFFWEAGKLFWHLFMVMRAAW